MMVIAAIVSVILSIVFWFKFHQWFSVFYTGDFIMGMLGEWALCLFAAACITGILVYVLQFLFIPIAIGGAAYGIYYFFIKKDKSTLAGDDPQTENLENETMEAMAADDLEENSPQ